MAAVASSRCRAGCQNGFQDVTGSATRLHSLHCVYHLSLCCMSVSACVPCPAVACMFDDNACLFAYAPNAYLQQVSHCKRCHSYQVSAHSAVTLSLQSQVAKHRIAKQMLNMSGVLKPIGSKQAHRS